MPAERLKSALGMVPMNLRPSASRLRLALC
jgi:hypothetical protein